MFTITQHMPSDLTLAIDWLSGQSFVTLAIFALGAFVAMGALASLSAFSADRY